METAYSKSQQSKPAPVNRNSRGDVGNRITPAASEGVIGTRGMVPRLCREFFFLLVSQTSFSRLLF